MRKLTTYIYFKLLLISHSIEKHKALYFVLSHTWGLPMTLLGYIISIIMILTGHLPHKYNNIYYFTIGKSWGGLELGTCFLMGKNNSEHIKMHEYGHTYQNCILGIFFIPLVSIPSAIRYWYRRIREIINKPCKTSYDDIWFEGSATSIGEFVTLKGSIK